MNDPLTIAGREFRSRLITGTGKYPSFEAMRDAVVASACELVTVAVRRIDLDDVGEAITDWLPEGVTLLPNTAGCQSAEEAVRVARLARAGGLPDWIKLEVIPDPRYLLPDGEETLRAATQLVDEGFTVLPTCSRIRCYSASSRRPAARRSCRSRRRSAPGAGSSSATRSRS